MASNGIQGPAGRCFKAIENIGENDLKTYLQNGGGVLLKADKTKLFLEAASQMPKTDHKAEITQQKQ